MPGPLAHLLRLQHLVRAELRHSLTDLDLTPVQNTVMHLISATPGSSSAELARHTHVTPQTMHKLVADLEQRGLLTLHPRAGHGRILDAHLTNQGRQVMADADKRAKAIEARMLADLDKQQQTQLADLLRHCVTALDAPPDE